MTDKEIIQALEICTFNNRSCGDCLYKPETEDGAICMDRLLKDALDLINRQQEKLKVQADNIHATLKMKDVEIQRTRAEAIKDFAEKLKEKMELSENFKKYGYHEIFAADDVERETDELIIEMVGAGNG